MEKEDNNVKESGISEGMHECLKQQEIESEIQALIDAAREVGLNDYSREEAIKALIQAQEHQWSNNE